MDNRAAAVNDAAAKDDDVVAAKLGIFESDWFQRIMIIINIAVAAYSAVMAALMSLFVPQHCCPEYTIDDWGVCRNLTSSEDVTASVKVVCSVSDNFDFAGNNRFNNFVLVINFLTLGMLLVVFSVEFWRENFLIAVLDIDKTKIDGHLKEHVFPRNKYPSLQPDLKRHNGVYYWTYLFASLLWFVNAMASAVLVFRYYFLDTRTATVYVTNNLLLLTRFIKALGVASASIKDERGVSFYTAKQVTFNVVDKDYKKKYQPGGAKHHLVAAAAGGSSVAAATTTATNLLTDATLLGAATVAVAGIGDH